MSRTIVAIVVALAMGWFAVGCDQQSQSTQPTGNQGKQGLETAAEREAAGNEDEPPPPGPGDTKSGN